MTQIKEDLEDLEQYVLKFKKTHILEEEDMVELINSDGEYAKFLPQFNNDYKVNMAYFLKKEEFLNIEFSFNNELFFEVLEKKVKLWGKFSAPILNNKMLFKEVIKKDPESYNELWINNKQDKEYNELLLKEGADILFYMPDEFKNDPEMIKLFIDNVKNPSLKKYLYT